MHLPRLQWSNTETRIIELHSYSFTVSETRVRQGIISETFREHVHTPSVVQGTHPRLVARMRVRI